MVTDSIFWAGAAGAMEGFRSGVGGRLLRVACLLLFCTTLPAQSAVDSLRAGIVERRAGGERHVSFRPLIRACADADDCLEEQLTWASKTLGDSAYYDLCYDMAAHYIRAQVPERAIQYAQRGVAHARANRDTLPWGHLLGRIGYVYTNLTTQSDSAAHYLYRSIELMEPRYAAAGWYNYYALGFLNDQLGLPQKALDNFSKAYRLSRPTGRRMDYGFALFHLLSMSLEYSARDTFNRYWPEYVVFREGAKSTNPQHDAFLNMLSGEDDAVRQLEAVVADSPEETIDPSSLGILYGSLSYAYQKRSKFTAAERYLRKAIDHEKQIGREGNLLRYYDDLIRLGDESKQPALTVEGFRGGQALRDSIARREYRENIGRLEVEYETQKTRTELAESQLALSESLRQRNQLLLGGVGLSLLTLLGFLFYQNRLKLQRLQTSVERERREQEVAEERRKAELSNLRSLIEGQETERARVARDLHDGLGGLLTTVKAHIASIPETREAEQLIDRACTSVRRIAHNMVPQTLTETGLAGSLGDLAAQLRVQGYEVDLEIIGDPDSRLDLHQRAILLRIAQELTHNVVKHAGASSILVQLLERPAGLLLIVEDDGKGFNLDHAKRTSGLGIASIEQRVAYLGGEILYDSSPGQGTTVTVEV